MSHSLKDSQERFMVCICTVQTGLLYLRRAAEACSSSSQRGPFTYPLSGPASPPPSPFFSSPQNQVAFCSPAAVLITRFSTAVLPPLHLHLLLLLSGNERIFFFGGGGIDLVSPAQILKECGLSLVSRCLKIRGFCARSPLSLSVFSPGVKSV